MGERNVERVRQKKLTDNAPSSIDHPDMRDRSRAEHRELRRFPRKNGAYMTWMSIRRAAKEKRDTIFCERQQNPLTLPASE